MKVTTPKPNLDIVTPPPPVKAVPPRADTIIKVESRVEQPKPKAQKTKEIHIEISKPIEA
jgi:hypothetical protein